MAFGFRVLTPPGECVSLAEAKRHCRVDDIFTSDDDLLYSLIIAAREYVEAREGRALVSQRILLTYDRFPRYSQLGGLQYSSEGLFDQRIPVTEMAARYWPDRAAIRLPRPPLQAVESLQYVAEEGVLSTLASDQYRVDTTTELGRVTPNPGVPWPIILQETAAVQLTYVAGYGPVTTVALDISAGAQTVTPASMFGIYAGTRLGICSQATGSGSTEEWVTVTAVTDTTFAATFARGHAGTVSVNGVPRAYRAAMKMMIYEWYQYRGITAVPPGAQSSPLPMGVEALLQSMSHGEYY